MRNIRIKLYRLFHQRMIDFTFINNLSKTFCLSIESLPDPGLIIHDDLKLNFLILSVIKTQLDRAY